jgi:hypothetical protein
MRQTILMLIVLGLTNLLITNLANASAILTLSGVPYSSNDREVGIQQGTRVYYVDRKVFSANGTETIINSKTAITVRVKMSDITRVVPLPKSKNGRDVSSLPSRK